MQGLFESVAFDAPTDVPDGYGGVEIGWEERYDCRAEFIYARGDEALVAARLQGRSVYKLRIRTSAGARTIVSGWRMRDLRRGPQPSEFPGERFQILEVDPITDRAWVYLVVQSGVAT